MDADEAAEAAGLDGDGAVVFDAVCGGKDFLLQFDSDDEA